MLVLIAFAFLAGVVTILSPCILPLLPIILTSSTTGSKKYPWGIVTGFILSFTFFTLFLTLIVNLTGISANFLRYLAIVIIFVFGLVLVIPRLQVIFEIFASKIAAKGAKLQQKSPGKNSASSANSPASSDASSSASSTSPASEPGFPGGLLIGASLGLVWTPCVGPILASVLALALTGTVTAQALFITLAYALGTAIPMLAILYGGRALIQKIPSLLRNLGRIQKVFGFLMILTAVALFFNFDRQFQSYITEKFPNYGAGLTALEQNEIVTENLQDMGMPTEQNGEPAPELIPGGEWFNSTPLTLQELKGKVVLIDFWTYSCINCIRTLPYLERWHEKYSDEGLVIIGVHTPEFEFEKDPDNLKGAIKDFNLTYPIVQDNNYDTWRAYQNHYWPAKYFVDHNGNIVSSHFGEGAYDESEELIQKLLKEAGATVDAEIANPTYQITSQSPETYLGYGRTKGLASPEPIKKDQKAAYTAPESLNLNQFALSGEWLIAKENAMPSAQAALTFEFSSKNVYLVMNPANTTPGQVKVYLDGELVTPENAGKDAKTGTITINEDRLYSLISLPEPGQHTLKLEFTDSNTEVFAFTFG